jgi:predicted transcriptional regulator of viral defense system
MDRLETEMPSYLSKALEVVSAVGRPMTVGQVEALGVNRMTLSQLASAGYVERPVRGVYHVPRPDDDQRVFWAAVSLGYDAVFCLRSAASFHGITEENAGHPDVAIPMRSRVPHESSFDIRVRVHKWPELARSTDVDTVLIQGIPVRVTSAARTVVDMFRHSEMNDDPAFRPVIDSVTFLDCLARFGEIGDNSELRKISIAHGCWDQIRKVSTTVVHTRSSLVPR